MINSIFATTVEAMAPSFKTKIDAPKQTANQLAVAPMASSPDNALGMRIFQEAHLDGSDINSSPTVAVGADRPSQDLSKLCLALFPKEIPQAPKLFQLLYYYNIPLLLQDPIPHEKEINDQDSGNEQEQEQEANQQEPEIKEIADNPKIELPVRDYQIQFDADYYTPPTRADFEHLRFNASELFEFPVTQRATERHDLNWLSFNDLYANRRLLDRRARYLLGLYCKSKWDKTSWLESGLKTTNGTLAQAILLLIVTEAWSASTILHMIVESNLRSKAGNYLYSGSNRRFISPRAACVKIKEFKNTYAPERLFPRCHAYIVLFESPEELRHVGHNPAQRREAYEKFFERNREILQKWKKKRSIRAFFLSNEITCLSIRDQIFNPHSHAVIWTDAESDASFIDAFIEAGYLIKYYADPKTNWADLKHFLPYMMRAHSLAAVYARQFNSADPVGFNKSTINALHAMIELQCGDGGGQGKRKIYREGIPKR